MANNTDKLKKLLEVFDSDTPTREEIEGVLKTLLKNFKETVRAMEERIARGEKDLLNKKEEILSMSKDVLEKWRHLSELENKGKNMELSHTKVSQKIESELAKIQKLSDELKGIKPSDLFTQTTNLLEKRLRPHIPRRDDMEGIAQEYIQEVETTINQTLEEKVKELRKEISAKSSGGVRRVMQPYRDNFTSQTDGVTKTFYLSREPLKTDTIMIWCSDFPFILDPAVDFTVSGRALTLTDAVDAPTATSSLVVIFFA